MKVQKKKKTKKKKLKLKLPERVRLKAGQFVELPGGLIIGEVPLEKIEHRKVRFRRMDSLQLGALKESIERLGVKDPALVVPNKKGGFDLVDGHHREDEISAQGGESIPVVVLTDKEGELVTAKEADLAMHRFNISAHTDGENFLQVLHEMHGSGISIEDIAKATAKDVASISEMVEAFTADLEEDDDDEDDTRGGAGSGGSRYDSATAFGAAENDEPTHESSRGIPLILQLPGTDDVRELLSRAVELFKSSSTSEAVVEALRVVVGRNDEGEE